MIRDFNIYYREQIFSVFYNKIQKLGLYSTNSLFFMKDLNLTLKFTPHNRK